MIDLSRIWPDWIVEKQLGRGSYGAVYKAVRRDYVSAEAAIKVISIPQSEDEIDTLRQEGYDETGSRTYYQEIVNYMIREIRLMQDLKGQTNIVSIEDYKVIEHTDRVGWDIYIRMELLTPLKSWLADKRISDGTLQEKDVLRLGTDICRALEICEKHHIIHRDIKPENIMVNAEGDFKLGDFGVARQLRNQSSNLSVQGAWPYMAPEIVQRGKYDGRVDLYSLGLVLYQLLNKNKLPFLKTEGINSASEREQALQRRFRGDAMPRPCEASDRVAAVILKACEYDPEKRYKNAAEMKAVLNEEGTGKAGILKFLILPVSAILILAAAAVAFRLFAQGKEREPSVPTPEIEAVYTAEPYTAPEIMASPEATPISTDVPTPEIDIPVPTIMPVDETPIEAAPPSDTPTGNSSTLYALQEGDIDLAAYNRITVSSATASSALKETAGTYPAKNVIDGKNDTAWFEGAAGYGIGESIELRFDGSQKIDLLGIYLGWGKSREHYYQYGRPEKLEIELSDGSIYTGVFEDTLSTQYVQFPESVMTESIKLRILSVYTENSSAEDTGVSEVTAYFKRGAMGPWSEWSTVKPAAVPEREIETRSETILYHMVHYGTQEDTPPNYYRVFRDYSCKDSFARYGARASYGEKHFTRDATPEEMARAIQYEPGSFIEGEYEGFQRGKTTAYYFGDDKYVWFIESEETETTYRYRDRQ